MSIRDEASHWLDRAEEAKVRAEQISDPKAKETMLGIVRGYERLAETALERQKSKNALNMAPTT